MRRSLLARLSSALLAIWFVLSIVAEPASLSGGAMPGMNMSAPRTRDMDMSGSGMSQMDMSQKGKHAPTARGAKHAQTYPASAAPAVNAGAVPVQTDPDGAASAVNTTAATTSDKDKQSPDDDSNCKQHDCCCSALSPSLLTPQSSLSWIPEHVIDQFTPDTGARVTYTEGQVLLPFANGPPNFVQR